MLLKFDTDSFNQWEAGQKIATNEILSAVASYQKNIPFTHPSVLIENFRFLLTHLQKDKRLLAEMLTLPTLKFIGEQMPVVAVDALCAAREFMIEAIATALEHEFLTLYHSLHTANAFDMADVGPRALRQVCLAYLCNVKHATHIALATKQFTQLGINMTDTMGAFKCLVNVENAARDSAIADFYAHFANDTLVLDKWFSLQATAKLPGTLDAVKALLKHEAFDIKNPNKVYALIAAFTHNNMKYFHAADGSGYDFLADVISKLDPLNPQVAARMVRPLVEWHRFDAGRQIAMKKALNAILGLKNLSKDVYEIVSKSL